MSTPVTPTSPMAPMKVAMCAVPMCALSASSDSHSSKTRHTPASVWLSQYEYSELPASSRVGATSISMSSVMRPLLAGSMVMVPETTIMRRNLVLRAACDGCHGRIDCDFRDSTVYLREFVDESVSEISPVLFPREPDMTSEEQAYARRWWV